MTVTDQGLVVVGNRTAAIASACRLYTRVIQLADHPSKPRAQDNLSTLEMPRNDSEFAKVAEYITRRLQPVGVAALTEGSVVVAARVREALGLDGLGLTSARACTAKGLMKQTMRAAGIRVTKFVTAAEGLRRDAIIGRLGLPLVLKRERGSGGRELEFVREPGDAPEFLPDGWMAEAFIDGVEMSIESFVSGCEPLFVNFTDYAEPRWANIVPADPSALPVAELLELNRRVIEVLEIERGMTHMEVFLTREGVVFGEIAARPPGGRIMELLELAYGFDPWQALFAVEAGERPSLPAEAQRVAGMRLVHPGPGTVVAVNGRDRLQRQPGLVHLHCFAKPGKTIAMREGAGQAAGYALFAGDRACVEAGLDCVQDHFEIVVG